MTKKYVAIESVLEVIRELIIRDEENNVLFDNELAGQLVINKAGNLPQIDPAEIAERHMSEHDRNCGYWLNRLDDDCKCGASKANQALTDFLAALEQK